MKDKKTEVAVIDFTKFDIQQLPELHGKKEEIKKVIKANPIVKITDNASYELAKKSRTAVKTLRTSLEKEKKEVNDRIKKSVLEVVANEYDSLITSVRNDENARQEEVTAWEEIKEQERLEKLRLEQERVDGIKNSISEFRQFWEGQIPHVTFDVVEEMKSEFEKRVVDFDRASLAEFEVLFDDAVSHLTNLLNSKIEILTEQENIRIEQIRLAEEREKQEEEAKKLAEIQRIQREEFEAEQKRVAEEQRIAQENFLKEKREFEEKQAEAKFQERCKQISDLGFVLNEGNFAYQKGLHYLNLEDIRNASDELWICELSDAKSIKDFSEMAVEESNESAKEEYVEEGRLVEREGVLFDTHLNKVHDPSDFDIERKPSEVSGNRIVQADYHEADVDPKGVITEEFPFTPKEGKILSGETQEVEFEETWESIESEFDSHYGISPKHDLVTTSDAFEWLSNNYNVPTRKN